MKKSSLLGITLGVDTVVFGAIGGGVVGIIVMFVSLVKPETIMINDEILVKSFLNKNQT